MESMGQEMSYNTILGIVWQRIASMGWYLVGLGVVLLMASSYLQEKYKSWKSKKDEEEYSAKYHKDPDVVYQRMTAIEDARKRMQEKYNQDCESSREKEEEIKEKKRQELLKSSDDSSGGNRLGGSTSNTKSRLLKQEYNPLMGNSSQSYRPPKRSCCGKGGCG